jgi:hypothetical protein
MGFHIVIFLTLLSSAMCSTWPDQLNLCILINLIVFCSFINSFISWLVLNLQLRSSDFVGQIFSLWSFFRQSSVYLLDFP